MDLITVFKIVHGLEGVPFDNLFTFHNTIQEAMATNCLSIFVIGMFENLVLLRELLMIGINYRHF